MCQAEVDTDFVVGGCSAPLAGRFDPKENNFASLLDDALNAVAEPAG